MALDVIESPILGHTKHGFFTRKGGQSKGLYSGLNCGLGSRDTPQIVEQNRTKVSEYMGGGALFGLYQVHSNDVVTITDTETSTETIKADALVTAVPDTTLAILTADCQPVLFSDAQAGVIGAAHAGWQGALNGVLEATIDAMITQGAQRTRIKAAIGPCISQKAYEVGPEFFEKFFRRNTDYQRFFNPSHNIGKYLFNLPQFGLERLKNAGIGAAEWVGHCTYADSARFYSYRRTTHNSEADYGRLISTIRL